MGNSGEPIRTLKGEVRGGSKCFNFVGKTKNG